MKHSLITLLIIIGTILNTGFTPLVMANSRNVISTQYSPNEINTLYDKIQQDSDFQQKLKQFQEQELATIASQTSLNESNIKERQQEISSIYGELEEIQSQFDTISKQKKFIDNKISETKQSVQLIINQALKTQAEADHTLKQIITYTNQISSLKQAIDQTNNDKQRARVMASKFLDILYRMTNELYTASSEIDDVKLFLQSENISFELNNTDLLQMVSLRYEQLIRYIDLKQQELKVSMSKLEESQLKYQTKLNEYRKKLGVLNQQKEYLMEYIKVYNTSKDGLMVKEDDLSKSKQELLDSLKKKIADSMTFIAQNNFIKEQIHNKETREDNEQFFGWPIYPVESIQGGYNSVEYIKKYGDTNIGIDLIIPQGSEVYAPSDGYIYEVNQPQGVSLGYLIIIHNYGYVSLLTTFNTIIVEKGQYVTRGQLLGISGGEPGTKGAGFGSIGPRIHRELFKDAVPVSVFEHTDLSSVKQSSTLPTQFEIKVLKDKLARKIDLSSVSYIQGTTLEDRIKNYINKYGNAPFDSYILRQQASAGHKVPLEFGVCIAVAETSFGRAFASRRNVGNVGNNDRGDRIDFSSPVEGASTIYYALENKYLGGYATLDKLSGYGNTFGAIYASSPINRQTNIAKCLTEIHGYWIPDDRPVRLYQAN
ncbi:MAG TPA: peptidoglycan DD-metalloendopeptidase family protein [Candidatus Absconditabacterales bacterium]|nr:peptidoglycan DD-metalloendopeptidase family protein [Candidatus Absconditabacterales bacterium]HNG96858.1 peptidoglycan DD-metalloendopeptidase family protein [Candidatus Absconditabacterales bacterium]